MSLAQRLPVVPGVTPTKPLYFMYAFFTVASAVAYFHIAEMQFSAILTLAGMAQCFAMMLLTLQPLLTGSVTGISLPCLVLHIFQFACRLSSTTWLNGYLPMDETGDQFYQGVDILALILTCLLALRVCAGQPSASENAKSLLQVFLTVLVCSTLAVVFHANLDLRPVYDTLWMTGLFCGSLAVLPQFWMVSSKNLDKSPRSAHAEIVASHAVAAMCMGHVSSAIYMWYARSDVACEEWIEGFNHAIWAILAAHAVPLLVVCDFAPTFRDT